MTKRVPLALAVGFVLCTGTQNLEAQRDRIAAQVVPSDTGGGTTALRGQVHPAATAANDRGRADAAMAMPNMTLLLAPSADQQKALEGLLARQQDPSSPDYHHWLTPEEYADQFGLSQADIGKITAWLQSQGFTVISTARGRNSVAFGGTASQVEKAFRTEIHHYMVQGRLHYANTTDPSIPATLGGVVGSIRGLHDFRPKARKARVLKPHCSNDCYSQGEPNTIAPDDIAAIYDIKSLYGQGINGAGQKIVIVGQTQIALSDIQKFQTTFNLPANPPTVTLVPGFPDPGISQQDLAEADLDIEIAGAVARGANVIFVYSQNVDDAIKYAIDNNLAPVLSSSYGLCEADMTLSDAQGDQKLAQKAIAEGITWVTASGDNGAVDCYSDTERTNPGFGADEPGTIPEVTSVGGTEFNEASGTYWNSTNDANQASAKGYIPETTWNDSVADGSPSSSGGGASMFFTKPSWQSGTGVPNDGFRDVPDISFSSSADHDGYLIYSGGSMSIFGGTSVAAPLFAGILTLLNQYQLAHGYQTEAGLGPINPKLYSLAAAAPGVFHDITTGNNDVDPCGPKTTATCNPTPIGFNAGPGYDQATGLGSIDVNNFFLAWNGQSKGTPTLTLTANPTTFSTSSSTVLTAVVTGTGGSTPSGSITWSTGSVTLGSATLNNGTATLTVPWSGQLPTGTVSIAAVYGGDGSYFGLSGNQTLTVTSTGNATPNITSSAAVLSAASFQGGVSGNAWVVIYGTNLSLATGDWSNSVINGILPTKLNGVSVAIGGQPAYVYYVSPTQINVLAPSIGAGSVQVTVTNANGTSTPVTVTSQPLQPAFFQWGSYAVATSTDYHYLVNNGTFPASTAPATPGQVILLWGTGFGATSPAAPAGVVTPSNGTLYSTASPVTVTVGNVPATVYGAALTPTTAGLYQVAIQVPPSLPNGDYPVVATINGAQSPATTLLTVHN